MTKLLPLAVLAVAPLALSSPRASAQTYVATDGSYPHAGATSYAPDPMYKQLDARLGLMLGGADIGDADGFSGGASAAVGYRLGEVTLRATLDYFRVGDGADETMSRKGRSTRLGGALRYSFAHNAYNKTTALDFWGELGAGYEHVAWRHGGVLDRPSGELGVGFDAGWRGRADRQGRRRKLGYFMAFRTFVAQGPEMAGVAATCGGPCSRATKPSRTDVTMFLELGVHWGR